MASRYEHLNGIYKEIAEIFGREVSKKIFEEYRGLNVNFPVRFYDRSFLVECIRKEYKGDNIRALAKKYGYSDRWIRKIIKGDC